MPNHAERCVRRSITCHSTRYAVVGLPRDTSFSDVTFVLFRVRLYAFIEAAALRSIVPRYAGAVTATRVSSFFPFVSLEMMPFPSTFCTIAISSSYGECVIRFFLPGGDFLPCDHGLDF